MLILFILGDELLFILLKPTVCTSYECIYVIAGHSAFLWMTAIIREPRRCLKPSELCMTQFVM